MIRKKNPTPPSRDARLATAEAMSKDALGLFDQAALQLENAAQERTDIADEVAVEAEQLRSRAIELDKHAESLDLASENDLYAAGRIRALFA